jgi:hypothetical protein
VGLTATPSGGCRDISAKLSGQLAHYPDSCWGVAWPITYLWRLCHSVSEMPCCAAEAGC